MRGTSIRVGVSGWRYAPWRGSFYPNGLPQAQELAYAAAHFPVLELNGSFYALQRPSSYASWYGQTPQGFLFTVKAPRFITHIRRLRDVEVPVANFLASGLFRLKEKLGPILWQLPPSLRYDREVMQRFLALLPHDSTAAARLARRRDARLRGRASIKPDAERPMRHAMEIRHESFLDDSFIQLLREYRVALVIAETARRWPMIHDVTADFIYMRLHGDRELYRSGYSDRALTRWAGRIRCWADGREPRGVARVLGAAPSAGGKRAGGQKSNRGRDVYCFFDNTDVKLRAPADATTLMRKLGVQWPKMADRWVSRTRT